MNSRKQPGVATRDDLLRILSDEEVARVGMAETAASLEDGDEFIDLVELDRGVQRVGASKLTPTGDVLAKKAVHQNTWLKVVANLSARRPMAPPPPPPRWPR